MTVLMAVHSKEELLSEYEWARETGRLITASITPDSLSRVSFRNNKGEVCICAYDPDCAEEH